MRRRESEKNILDLKYQFQMQKIHAALTMLTIGVLSFIGTFMWYSSRLFFGFSISLLIIVLSLFYYVKTKRQLIMILKDIRKLYSE